MTDPTKLSHYFLTWLYHDWLDRMAPWAPQDLSADDLLSEVLVHKYYRATDAHIAWLMWFIDVWDRTQ